MAIYVNLNASGSNDGSSWNNAFTDLQSAIDSATSGEEIWVAAGTYKPGDAREDSFQLKNGVNIYGGFAGNEDSLEQRDVKTNVTTLSGDIGTENDKSDNSHTVVKLSSGTATLDGFTIQDGNNNQADDNLNDGGGVYNAGDLTLKNVVVRNNQAADDGGGIRNNGTITIIDSTIADNKSVGETDTSGGGGLINTGTLATIINSTFSGNTAKNGGAIRNDTTLQLINSTLSGNTASFSGGGLVNTISPNILLARIMQQSLPGFTPSDISGTAQATITNTTITNNTAQDTSGSGSPVGSGVANFAKLNIANSIIADNASNDDVAHNFTSEIISQLTGFPIPDNVVGQNNSNGNNLIGNGEGISGFTDGTNGDIVGTQAQPIDPKLDTLKDNGGATQTHALLEESPAINAGNNALIAQQVSNLDGRVVGDAVDIGASEYKPKPASNPSNIIINEIDVDTPGTDNAEFIELYDGGVGNTSLDGYVVVLYNGSDNQSYNAYDLDGFNTDANGYFVLGNSGVNNVNLVFDNNTVQNGVDAVALYQGDATDFPNDTAITTENLIDAVVYDVGAADNPELLTLLNSGQPQVNENDSGDKDNQSLQRITNGSGGSRNTNTYQVAAPTPGAENILVTDTLPGGGDTLPGGGDTLPGGGDTLPGGGDTLPGGGDTLPGGGDTLPGGGDTLPGGGDTLPGGGDTLPGGGDTLPGGGDTLPGGGDTLPGGATLTPLTDGKDRFRGTATNDQISSGTGNDFLKGGAGNDVFDAGADNDRVYGGIGEDTISGGTGKDYLNGGSGLDSLDGGEGRDKLYGGDGDDTLIGGVGNDFLKGENGNDFLDGGADRDRLYGNDGDDTLTGGSGNDKIYGGAGDDMITGVNADSFAVGEIDRLYGGADNDTFVLGNENGAFYADDDSTTKGKRDYAYILDFETGDTIELYGSADDYTLDVSRGSTSIYLNNDDENGVGDLIGKIKGVSFEDMNSGFSFAGGGNPDLT